MGLLHFIRGLLGLQPEPTRPTSPLTPAETPSADHQPTNAATIDDAPTTTSPVPPPTITITIEVRDQATHATLCPAATLTGFAGDALELTWPVLPGRLFAAVTDYQDTFPDHDQTITLYYQEVQAAPVVVYHRGPKNELLAPPEQLLGTVGMAFTISALPEAAERVIGEATQQGVFTTHAQTVRFSYGQAGIESGRVPDAAYIEVLVDKLAFAHARDTTPLTDYLPQGTVWQVFGLVREINNHQVWLNLGGTLWITATHTKPHQHNPFLPAPHTLTPPKLSFTSHKTAHRAAARVNGPEIGTTQWDAPYGQALPERLRNGEQVLTVATVELNDDTTWYELSNHHFVQAHYLDFTSIV